MPAPFGRRRRFATPAESAARAALSWACIALHHVNSGKPLDEGAGPGPCRHWCSHTAMTVDAWFIATMGRHWCSHTAMTVDAWFIATMVVLLAIALWGYHDVERVGPPHRRSRRRDRTTATNTRSI